MYTINSLINLINPFTLSAESITRSCSLMCKIAWYIGLKTIHTIKKVVLQVGAALTNVFDTLLNK